MKRLFKFAIFAGLAAGIVKLAQTMKLEPGTEDELRSRVESKLGDKVPADKLKMVQDKVVEVARAKGKLIESAGAATNGQGAEETTG